jgi:hypothetical protein
MNTSASSDCQSDSSMELCRAGRKCTDAASALIKVGDCLVGWNIEERWRDRRGGGRLGGACVGGERQSALKCVAMQLGEKAQRNQEVVARTQPLVAVMPVLRSMPHPSGFDHFTDFPPPPPPFFFSFKEISSKKTVVQGSI